MTYIKLSAHDYALIQHALTIAGTDSSVPRHIRDAMLDHPLRKLEASSGVRIDGGLQTTESQWALVRIDGGGWTATDAVPVVAVRQERTLEVEGIIGDFPNGKRGMIPLRKERLVLCGGNLSAMAELARKAELDGADGATEVAGVLERGVL